MRQMLELNKLNLKECLVKPERKKREEVRMRDPFIFADQERGLYFLYGTSEKTCDGAANVDPYFEVYVGESLEEFVGPYVCFEPPVGFWGVKHYWAPEVHEYKGSYYMFASFKGGIGEDRGTGILKADLPEGPYVPWSNGAATLKGHECLDGTLYVDDQGQPWIIFCHEWTEMYYGKIKALRLTEDLQDILDEEAVVIVDLENDKLPWIHKMSDQRVGKEGYLTDAPFMWKLPSGRLLMTWSCYTDGTDGNEKNYVIAGCVSDSGKIEGPWRHLPELLLNKDAGHAALFRDLDGKPKIVMHGCDAHHGSEYPVVCDIHEEDDKIEIVWR